MVVCLLSLLLATPPKPAYLAADGLVLGYETRGTWHKVDSIRPFSKRLALSHVGLGKTLGSFTSHGIQRVTDGIDGTFLNCESSLVKGIYFSGEPQFPRPVQVLSNASPTYLKVVGTFLRAHGVKSKPRLTRIVSADLDGSGSSEVILEASSRDDLLAEGMHAGRTGDYSLVLVRYLDKGKVIEKALEFSQPDAGSMPYLNRIEAIADFDGKGTLELAVSSNYYEGSSCSLLRFRHGKLTKLVANGAGA